MDDGGDLQPQVTFGSGEESLISDLFVEMEEDSSMNISIPMEPTAAVSFCTYPFRLCCSLQAMLSGNTGDGLTDYARISIRFAVFLFLFLQ